MDADLVAVVTRAQAGDRHAFDELARRYWRSTWLAARRHLCHDGRADEAAQDALVIAWRNLRDLRDPSSFGGWLRRIVVNAAKTPGPRRQRPPVGTRVPLDTIAARTFEDRPDPPRLADLRTAMAHLLPRDRAVLDLFYFHGTPVKRMARTLRVPVGTVKRRLHTARRRLRVLMTAAA